jgi:rhodanese-related sulfurtransferase
MRLFRQLLLLLVTIIAGLSHAANAQVSPLQVIDQELRANFPNVASVDAADLQMLMADPQRPIILDVREAKEFAVSHIQDAVRIDPDAELDDVLQTIGPDLKGRAIIVYCSVGMRSTELADRIRAGLKGKGASRIANLSEGIFGWHNAKRPLVRGKQATSYVHPYDALWGQLLRQQNLTAYVPVLQGQKPATGWGSNETTRFILAFLGIFALLALAAGLRSRRLRQLLGGQKS